MANVSASAAKPGKSFLERLSNILLREPEDRDQLLDILQHAHERNLLDDDALSMIEGVLHVGELAARDIMVPRAQMDLVDVDASLEDILAFAVEKTHSRFPVFEGQRDNIIGILLAKDLLQRHFRPNMAVRSVLRPAVFIPETKRLNVLLRDFRLNRNHIAMVVDEFGGVSGLVTIEDVLEQIVGNIEDEYDFDDTLDNIVPIHMGSAWAAQVELPLGNMDGGLATSPAPALGPAPAPAVYRVKGTTDIAQFNAVCGASLPQDQATTVGGLLCSLLGHVPRRGVVHVLPPWRFQVLLADERHVQLLKVQSLSEAELAQWLQAPHAGHGAQPAPAPQQNPPAFP